MRKIRCARSVTEVHDTSTAGTISRAVSTTSQRLSPSTPTKNWIAVPCPTVTRFHVVACAGGPPGSTAAAPGTNSGWNFVAPSCGGRLMKPAATATAAARVAVVAARLTQRTAAGAARPQQGGGDGPGERQNQQQQYQRRHGDPTGRKRTRAMRNTARPSTISRA